MINANCEETFQFLCKNVDESSITDFLMDSLRNNRMMTNVPFFERKNANMGISPFRRYFFSILRRKDVALSPNRPGAISKDKVKRKIDEIGVGGIAEIYRIGYDGQLDDFPIIIKILSTGRSGFSGKVINVEREFIEESSEKKIYARRGGGIIEFNFDDGDIKDIKENIDYQELSAERNIGHIVAALNALDAQDRILVAYFDKKHQGTVNFEGILQAKLSGNRSFLMTIDKINGVELERKINKQFDIRKELVIDVSIT